MRTLAAYLGRRAFGLCALFLCAALAQTPEQAEKSRRAKELMGAGRFADAIPLYEDLLRQVPGNPGLTANLAIALHMSGRDSEAISQFERVLRVQPEAYPALMMSGVSYMRLGQPTKAAPLFERALKLQPGDTEARQMLADAFTMIGRHESAAAQLRRVTAALPNEPRPWYALGRAWELLAQTAYEKLLKSYPESPYTIAVTAEARLKQGRLDSARALFERAGNVPGVREGLAESLGNPAPDTQPNCSAPTQECRFRARRYTAVLQAAKPARSAESLFWQVRAYNALALEAFQKLAGLPASAELHEVLAEVHRNQGRYKDSVIAWEEALKLAPGNRRLRRELAATLYLGQQYARAESELRELLRLEADAPDLLFLLGDSILNQQRATEAAPLLRKAVEKDPKHLPAHAALARSYIQSGEQDKAIPHLELALPVDTDGSLHYQLAQAYQSAGRSAEARKLLVRYQELQAEATAP